MGCDSFVSWAREEENYSTSFRIIKLIGYAPFEYPQSINYNSPENFLSLSWSCIDTSLTAATLLNFIDQFAWLLERLVLHTKAAHTSDHHIKMRVVDCKISHRRYLIGKMTEEISRSVCVCFLFDNKLDVCAEKSFVCQRKSCNKFSLNPHSNQQIINYALLYN
jgi:hypothetical protein